MKDKLFKLDFGIKVKFYPYRRAMVYGVFFEVNRFSEEARNFEKELNRKAGEKYIDNHTAYTITNRDGSMIHISCSDDVMRFGSVLEEKAWWYSRQNNESRIL